MHKENVFFGDGQGSFRLRYAEEAFPESENLGFDDNRIIAFDYDSDGDVDIFIGSLSGPDRLAINDGAGHFRVAVDVVVAPESKGTLGIQAADLNGDGRLDLVMAQGEVKGHEAEMVLFGAAIAPDTAAPRIEMLTMTADGCARARVYDNNSPTRTLDFQAVSAKFDDGEPTPMTWYGEHLWRACPTTAPKTSVAISATDAAGNQADAASTVN